MNNQFEIIDRYTVGLDLAEALDSLCSAEKQLAAGEYSGEGGDGGMIVDLSHTLSHLCLAWHRRKMEPEETMTETQEEYEEKAVTIPNWGHQFSLTEYWESHHDVNQYQHDNIMPRTVSKYLSTAKKSLQNFLTFVDKGQYDQCEASSFSGAFVPIVKNLCLAWHLRYLTLDEVTHLDSVTIAEIGTWLPKWQWDYRLCPCPEIVRPVENAGRNAETGAKMSEVAGVPAQ